MTDQGEVKTTELVAFHQPVVDGTLADLGLALSEAKAVLAKPYWPGRWREGDVALLEAAAARLGVQVPGMPGKTD
jgi:hypothetical protein